jgi:predicted membrane-bound dolichyl-phosphate-mannose-protein mannosyltransferase
MKKKLTIILILLISLQLLFRIYQYKEDYLTKFDPEYWQERYLKSQWVVPNSQQSIGDDGLYAHAGWKYIHGADPSLLNAEIPPFGKYLIGLSEVIFNNQNIFSLLSGILVLISFFFLNKIIFKNTILPLLCVFLLSADPLFYSQLRAPYLDSLYLSLLILIFISVLRERFILANIFLGLMVATKASIPTFAIVSSVIVCYLFYMKENLLIKKFLISLPISVIVFLITYTQYFILGHNIMDFLGLQKWILNFYSSGAQGQPDAVWQMLLTGKWPTWWGTVETVSEWTIIWPISFLATLYYFYKVFPKRRQYKSTLLGFWIITYLIFLSFVPAWPRYLLVILPFMYILLIWVITKHSHRLFPFKKY